MSMFRDYLYGRGRNDIESGPEFQAALATMPDVALIFNRQTTKFHLKCINDGLILAGKICYALMDTNNPKKIANDIWHYTPEYKKWCEDFDTAFEFASNNFGAHTCEEFGEALLFFHSPAVCWDHYYNSGQMPHLRSFFIHHGKGIDARVTKWWQYDRA